MWFTPAAPFKQSCSNAAAESCAAAPPTLFCVFVGAPMCVLRAYYGVHKDRIRMEKEKTHIISIFFLSLFFRGGDSSSSSDFLRRNDLASLQENSRKKSRPFAASSLTLTSSSLRRQRRRRVLIPKRKKERKRERKSLHPKTHTHTNIPLIPLVAFVEFPPKNALLSSSKTAPPFSSTVCAADRPAKPPPTTMTFCRCCRVVISFLPSSFLAKAARLNVKSR